MTTNVQWVKNKYPIEIQTELKTYAYFQGHKIDKVIICMHGYGDNAENAAHLASEFQMSNALFLSIQGPNSVPMSFSGYQWFDLFHNPHKKIEDSAEIVLKLFSHLVDDHQISTEKIYFMGFSQGAAMALYCGLQTRKKIGGIVSMSGFTVHAAQLLEAQDSLNKDCPLFLIHGNQDQTIFPILFFEAKAFLEYLGFKDLLTKIYHMGHTVCAEELIEIKKFLTRDQA